MLSLPHEWTVHRLHCQILLILAAVVYSGVHGQLLLFVVHRFPDTSAAGLHHITSNIQVVGCTCLSINHPLLARRHFDVCIIDEASQINLPASLGPLMKASSFVLVGDHYQLSPLVTSPRAQEGGLGVSLFRRLCEASPQAVAALQRQYRMAEDIMLLSNTLIYSGHLKAGSDDIATAQLQLPDHNALEKVHAAST